MNSYETNDSATTDSYFFVQYGCVDVKVLRNDSIELYSDEDITLQQVLENCDLMKSLKDVFVIITLLLGMPGNLLSLLTIRTLPLSTGTFYVGLLSIADFCTLSVHGSFYMLERFKFLTVIACKLKIFTWSFISKYAHWILVCITFERYVTVRFPLQKSYYFTIKRAYVSAVLLVVVMLILSVAFLWTTSYDGNNCVVEWGYEELNSFLSYMDLVVYSVLPFALLFILVIAIAVELHAIQKNRKQFVGGSLTPGSTSYLQAEKKLREQSKVEHGITLMLFISAIYFVILTLPVYILVIRYFATANKNPLQTAKSLLAHAISLHISIFRHACNFFIYFFSASRFRKQLKVLLHCKPCFEKPDLSSDGGKESLQSNQEVPMTVTTSY